MRGQGGWFAILEAARTWRGEGFTAPELADTTGIKAVGEKSPAQVAAHWLYKFKTWGYVEVVGTRPGGGIRPLNVYVVTKKGQTCKPRAGRDEQLSRLVAAVRAFQKARRGPKEDAAFGALVKICDEVEG